MEIAGPIHPGSVKVVHGQGMPLAKEPGTRGDMRIVFDVRFPLKLNTEQRDTIRAALAGCTYDLERRATPITF